MGGRGNTVADEENPFDMDMSVLQKAIPVAPKPIKGRTVEVKCPMCESVGYVSPQHQGKDVKCYNAACKHPYFTVPLPKKETVDDGIRKKKGLTIYHILAMVVLGIGLVGTTVWWFVIRQPDPGSIPRLPPPPPPPPPPPGGNEDDRPPPVERLSLEEIQKGAINELVRVAGLNDSNQARAVRFLAESYAVTGQGSKALTELQKLAEKSPEPYMQIEPLVRLYLQARKAGVADAGKYLDMALKAAENLPQSGRSPLDAANVLAAALVLDNRMPAAQKLIGAGAEGSRADYSMLWVAATYGNSFNFQLLSEIPAWLAAPNPQHAAVTWLLASWGEYDKSLAWAKTAASVDSVDASLAAWAARVGQDAKTSAEGLSRIEAGLKDASKTGQCRAWSNFAYQRFVAGDAAAAKELATLADALLAEIPPTTPVAMPSIRKIYDSEGQPRAGLPDAAPQRSAALAAANLAVLHLKLGDKAAVETLIGKALDFVEAIAPSGPTVAALKAQTSDGTAMGRQFDKMLNLKGDYQAKLNAYRRYARQLAALEAEAERRLLFERELIRDIAYRGNPALAWKIVQNRDQIEPKERRSMLSATPLPYYIALLAVATGDNATANAIGAKAKDRDKIDEMIASIVFNMKEGKFEPAIIQMKTLYRAGTYDRDRIDISVLRRISQYHSLKGPEKVLELITQLPDPEVEAAAMFLLAARAVVEDKGPEFWKKTSPDRFQRSLSNGARAALARGYVAGVEAAPTEKAVVKKESP